MFSFFQKSYINAFFNAFRVLYRLWGKYSSKASSTDIVFTGAVFLQADGLLRFKRNLRSFQLWSRKLKINNIYIIVLKESKCAISKLILNQQRNKMFWERGLKFVQNKIFDKHDAQYFWEKFLRKAWMVFLKLRFHFKSELLFFCFSKFWKCFRETLRSRPPKIISFVLQTYF